MPIDSNGVADPLRTIVRFLLGEEQWKDRARCNRPDVNPEWFFPAQGKSTKKAKAVCALCPVTRECADYADRTSTEYGVWGGETRKRGRLGLLAGDDPEAPDDPA